MCRQFFEFRHFVRGGNAPMQRGSRLLLYKQSVMQSPKYTPANSCGFCGATSYRRVVARDTLGVLRATERLLCTGCTREFPDVKTWRQGRQDTPAVFSPAG